MIDRAPTMLALTTHARHVPMAERQAFAAAVHGGLAAGGLVVETCHRVEAYLPEDARALEKLRAALPTGARQLRGEAAVRHAITVAVGRDSVVQGEDQVVHQLRAALHAAQASGGLDPVIERVFAAALHAGRRARSWRVGPSRSLAGLALRVMEREAGALAGRAVLVVGAGQMGRLAAHAARAAGAIVSIASRSPERAADLARAVGAAASSFDPAPADLEGIAGIIVALGGPWPLRRDQARMLASGGAVIVDLSVPAALPPTLAEALPRGRLVSADDLAREDAEPGTGGSAADERVDRLIEQTTQEVQLWLDGHAHRAAAAMLAQRSDDVRASVLAGLWRELPELDPETRQAIDRMTRHLAAQLLREPLERLGRDVDGRAESAVREAFAL